MRTYILMAFMGFSLSACANNYYFEYGKKVELEKVYDKRDNSSVSYYQTKEGKKVGISDEIIVQCSAGVDCNSILKNYSLKSVSNLSDKLYLVKINNDQDIFEVSQNLYNDPKIELAHPNFLKAKKRR